MEEVTVFVEFEVNPQKHLHFISSDSTGHEERFLQLKNFIQSEIPNVKVIRSSLPGSTKRLINTKQNSNEDLIEPFEIYLFGQLIFSRRKTGKWPNYPVITALIKKIIQDRQDLSPSHQDLGDKVKFQNELKESKLPPLKANTNHRALVKIGRRNYNNKGLDYSAHSHTNDETIVIASPVKAVSQMNKTMIAHEGSKPEITEKSRSPLRRRIKVALDNLKRVVSQPIEREVASRERGPSKDLHSPVKMVGSSYMRRHQRKVEQVSYLGDMSSGHLTEKAYTVQGYESSQRSRKENVKGSNQFVKEERRRDNDSTDSNETISKLILKSKMKSASHPFDSKDQGSYARIHNAKERSDSVGPPQRKMDNFLLREPVPIKVSRVQLEDDDDSFDDQNPSLLSDEEHLQNVKARRKTEGNEADLEPEKIGVLRKEARNDEGIRTTADFGKKLKDFLRQSLSASKRLSLKANQKAASRYSDMSIEIDEFNQKGAQRVRDSMLSFGDPNSLKGGDKALVGLERKQEVNAAQKASTNKEEKKEVSQMGEEEQLGEGNKHGLSRGGEQIQTTSLPTGIGSPDVDDKYKLGLGENSFKFAGPTNIHNKGSTPQFARPINSIY